MQESRRVISEEGEEIDVWLERQTSGRSQAQQWLRSAGSVFHFSGAGEDLKLQVEFFDLNRSPVRVVLTSTNQALSPVQEGGLSAPAQDLAALQLLVSLPGLTNDWPRMSRSPVVGAAFQRSASQLVRQSEETTPELLWEFLNVYVRLPRATNEAGILLADANLKGFQIVGGSHELYTDREIVLELAWRGVMRHALRGDSPPAALRTLLLFLSQNEWFDGGEGGGVFSRLIGNDSTQSNERLADFSVSLLSRMFAEHQMPKARHVALLLRNGVASFERHYPHLAETNLTSLRFVSVTNETRLDSETWSILTNSLCGLELEALGVTSAFQPSDAPGALLFDCVLRQLIVEAWRQWPPAKENKAADLLLLIHQRHPLEATAKSEIIRYLIWTPQYWQGAEGGWTELFDPAEMELHQDVRRVASYELNQLAKPWSYNTIILSEELASAPAQADLQSAGQTAQRILRHLPESYRRSAGLGFPRIIGRLLRGSQDRVETADEDVALWSAFASLFAFIHSDSLTLGSKEAAYRDNRLLGSPAGLKRLDSAMAFEEMRSDLARTSPLYAGVVMDLLELAQARFLEDEARVKHLQVGIIHPVFRWEYRNDGDDLMAGAWVPDELNGHNPYIKAQAVSREFSIRTNLFAAAVAATTNSLIVLDRLSGPVVLASRTDGLLATNLASARFLPPFGSGGGDFLRLDYPVEIPQGARASNELDGWSRAGYLRYETVAETNVRPAFCWAKASPLQSIPPDPALARSDSSVQERGLPPVLSLWDQAVVRCAMDVKERRIALANRQDAFGFVGPLQHSDGPGDLFNRVTKIATLLKQWNLQDFERAGRQLDFAAQEHKAVAADYALMSQEGRYAKALIDLEVARKDLEQSSLQIDINRAEAVAHHFLQESSRQNAEAAQAAAAEALLKYDEVAYEQFKQRAQLEMLILALPRYVVELERATHQMDLLNAEMLKYHEKIDDARQRYLDSKSKDLGGFLKGIAVKFVDAVGAVYGMPGLGSMINSTFSGLKAASEGDWGTAFNQLSQAAAQGGLNAKEIQSQATKWVESTGVSKAFVSAVEENPVLVNLANRAKDVAKDFGLDEFAKAQALCIANRAVRSVVPSVPPVPSPDLDLKKAAEDYRVKLIAGGTQALRDYTHSSGNLLLSSFAERKQYEQFVRKRPGQAEREGASIEQAWSLASSNALTGIQAALRKHFRRSAAPTAQAWKKSQALFASRVMREQAKRVDAEWVATNPTQSNVLAAVDGICKANTEEELAERLKEAQRRLGAYAQDKVKTNAALARFKTDLERSVNDAIAHRDVSRLLVDGRSLQTVGRSLYESVAADVFDCASSQRSGVDTNTVAETFKQLQEALLEIEVVAEMSLTVVTALEFTPKQRGFMVETLAGWEEELQNRLDSLSTSSGVEVASTIRDYYQTVVNQYKEVDLAGYFSPSDLEAFLRPPAVTMDAALQKQLQEFDRNLRNADQVMKTLLSDATANLVRKQIKNIASLENDDSYNQGKQQLMEMLTKSINDAKKGLDANRVICSGNLLETPTYASFARTARANALARHTQQASLTDLRQLLEQLPPLVSKEVKEESASLEQWLKKDFPKATTAERTEEINEQLIQWQKRRDEFKAEADRGGLVVGLYKLRHHWAKDVISDLTTLLTATDEMIVETADQASRSLLHEVFGMDERGFFAGDPSALTETNASSPAEILQAMASIAATNDYWVFFQSRSIQVADRVFGLRPDSPNEPNLGGNLEVKRQLYQRSSDACKRFKAAVLAHAPNSGGLLGDVLKNLSDEWYQRNKLVAAEIAGRRTQHTTMAAALQAAAETSLRGAADLRARQAEVIRDMKALTVRGFSNLVEVADNERRRSEHEFEYAAIQRDRALLDTWLADVSGAALPVLERAHKESTYQRAIWACLRDWDFIQRYYLGRSDDADALQNELRQPGAIGRRGDLRTDHLESLAKRAAADPIIKMAAGINPSRANSFVFVVTIRASEWESRWKAASVRRQLRVTGNDRLNFYAIPFEFRPFKYGENPPRDYMMQDEPFRFGFEESIGESRPTAASEASPPLLRGPEWGDSQLRTDVRYVLAGVFVNHTNLNTAQTLATLLLRPTDQKFLYHNHSRPDSARPAVPYSVRWFRPALADGNLELATAQQRQYVELAAHNSRLNYYRSLFESNGGRNLDWDAVSQFEEFRLHPLLGRWELLVPSGLIEPNDRDWEIQIVFYGTTLQ